VNVKDAIFNILSNDAKIATAGHLGNLLGHTTTNPYGIYFMSPPEISTFPIITYNSLGAAGIMPRIEAYNFTVWGGDCDAILNIVENLLNKKPLGSTSPVNNIVLLWDWDGPDIFDDNFKVYTRSTRYIQHGVV
jgi:hypothetical protein